MILWTYWCSDCVGIQKKHLEATFDVLTISFRGNSVAIIYIYVTPPWNQPFWHIHQMVGSKGGYLAYTLRALYIYIYTYSNSVISMPLRLIELNFNDSILGKMHSECILCILGRMHSECITKNQDFPKTPEQILVRTKTKNQEQRFPRANLGSNQNQEPRFPQDSWANLGCLVWWWCCCLVWWWCCCLGWWWWWWWWWSWWWWWGGGGGGWGWWGWGWGWWGRWGSW